MNDITLIIPTLNEEASIETLLGRLSSLYPDMFVIVSDDGSADGTREFVREYALKNRRVSLLDREQEPTHGLTASVLDAALLVATPYFAVMDGDLQHPPETVKEFYERLVRGADVVIGTRRTTPKDWTISRRIISRTGNVLGMTRLLLRGRRIEDPVSGFFAGKTDLFQRMIRTKNERFVKEGFKVLMDFLKMLPGDTSIEPVYYSFRVRSAGKSKVGFRQMASFLKSLIT